MDNTLNLINHVHSIHHEILDNPINESRLNSDPKYSKNIIDGIKKDLDKVRKHPFVNEYDKIGIIMMSKDLAVIS